MDRQEFIQKRIVADMSEGVLTIGFDGVIEYVNEAVLAILEKDEGELVGRNFARVFLTDEKNDEFVQCVLDAIYDRGQGQEGYAAYQTEKGLKQLRIVSSCFREEGRPAGVVLVVSDITELTEMRDAVRAMEKIRELNRQLELRNRLLQETFGRYLSDDIVREILETPDGWKLGGQKQNLTVMMSDLRGFTAVSERMQPQDLISMLNHYFSEMYEEIERRHGTLIEFTGDGMLVIFGAPVRNETHASDAVAAAIGMQKRMEAVNLWNGERGFEPLHMGIGINTDSVILGNIGSERRTKYGVLGAAVNLAGRIESFTMGGQILISSGTRDAVRSELQIRQTLTVSPKGVKGEIPLYDITGIGAPYELAMEIPEEEPVPLPRSVPVQFSLLEGKQLKKSSLEGRILALSETGAVLKTEEKLALYDNLCLDNREDLCAKVVGIPDGNYRIGFTAKPPGFASWAEGLRSTPAMQLTVLGSRGSIAVSSRKYSQFGGSTSCYMVRAGDETVFLDAGSGLAAASASYPKPPVILLSHLHLDHVIGLGMFPLIAAEGQKARLYVPFCPDEEEARRLLERIFTRPFWPLKLQEYEGELEILPLPRQFAIGDLCVETMDGCHPGGCKVYKLSRGGRSLVYVTDFEHSDSAFSRLEDFCRDTDLLLYDAQYSSREYARRKGFGHSTAEKGLELMERSGARRLLLIHHDPRSTDSVLLRREESLPDGRASYARERQEIYL